MSADAPRPNATTAERMEHVAEQLDEIERWLAGLANEEAMTIGRIPERLGRAAALVGDAHDLVKAARREWIES